MAAGRRHEVVERKQEEDLIMAGSPDGSDAGSSHVPASCQLSVRMGLQGPWSSGWLLGSSQNPARRDEGIGIRVR